MKISIIGGGIGGLCTAIGLQKAGFDVQVFEAATSFKPLGAGLALSSNAMEALGILGISEEIIKKGKILRQFSVLDEKGRIISTRNTEALVTCFGIDNFTIHRADLHEILIDKLRPNSIFIDNKLKSFQQEGESIKLFFKNGVTVETDCLIGADGVHSVVRSQLLPESRPRYSGYTCWRAVIEKMPEGFNQTVFSETWGSKGRFGVVPLSDNRIYWYACLNASENSPAYERFGIREIGDVFKEFDFPIAQIIALTNDAQLIHNDIIDIRPIDRFAFANVLLIGDAAHATTPNMGQGACQAIEDALFLTNCFKKYKTPVVAFKNFERVRMKRTHRIVKTSWTLGKIAQWESPLACKIRNLILRSIPQRFNQKQLEFLYNVDFEKV